MDSKESNSLGEKKKISFDISSTLLKEMENQRKGIGATRATWISIAIMEKLARDRDMQK